MYTTAGEAASSRCGMRRACGGEQQAAAVRRGVVSTRQSDSNAHYLATKLGNGLFKEI